MSKVQYNAKEKFAMIEEIESGELGLMGVAYKYGISKSTLVKWRRRYDVYGLEGLEVRTKNRSYSAELKLQAVLDYLKGELSQCDIIHKYKIASRTQLSN
ncbi:transposase IS3/IS911 family protein [Paenibacillus larvae subsp. larvae]|uniref:Transposase IS3/IS911 family protein n=3 Tax=Paenibacillus larvae TaxID=1464 RepID=V9W6G5_9BACL|nr:helix-turn-helix domain-containing protein [Paenibacillus larvae]ETK27075.1 transposase IS3/IS911 family protein [Paenibacillus larvae subsp. larvae DSM 25719]AHD05534.1 transposase IS3/IS911 family protein [Paenibacillus larvae subsp. larvae DSM 25430]AVF22088.1 transposase IS3/IS911 family protein [Paenibacillus larvae subsp. larvae]AVG12091.1 transposase IS3/IS911 family protein [Paenibacillus larvae subsp. larvae DSM 25430]MDE5124707.1 transposase [Paenibacillus larvae subsp. larvae]